MNAKLVTNYAYHPALIPIPTYLKMHFYSGSSILLNITRTIKDKV
jgi:hypothetical protein